MFKGNIKGKYLSHVIIILLLNPYFKINDYIYIYDDDDDDYDDEKENQ